MNLKFNPFLILVGILQIGGSVWFLATKNPKMSGLMFLYGLTNFILAFLKG